MLRAQWREQIDRHTAIHVLPAESVFIDEDESLPLPPAKVLAKLHIIVTTHKRLADEWKHGKPVAFQDLNRPVFLLEEWAQAKDQARNKSSSVPASYTSSSNTGLTSSGSSNTTSSINTTYAEHHKSPLLDIIFSRIAFDEGHTLGKSTLSESLLMASTLLTKARWILSGTPTPSDQNKALQYLRHQVRLLWHVLHIY